jgi:hypothetical protein
MTAAGPAAKAWEAAAKQLNDRKQLEAACQTIFALGREPSARTTVVVEAVISLNLPRALLEATAEVLSERKRQHDWRREACAARVTRVTGALLAVLNINGLAPLQQQPWPSSLQDAVL